MGTRFAPENDYLICTKVELKKEKRLTKGGIALPENMADPDKPGVEHYHVRGAEAKNKRFVGKEILCSAYGATILERGVFGIKTDDVVAIVYRNQEDAPQLQAELVGEGMPS